MTAIDTLSSYEVARAAGITYRQLDYWLRRRVIKIDGLPQGSGMDRRFTREQADLICQVAQTYRQATDVIDSFRCGLLWEMAVEEASRKEHDDQRTA